MRLCLTLGSILRDVVCSTGREVWGGGQLVLNKVPQLLLSYYVGLIIARLFTPLFPLPILIRAGGF